MDNKVISQAGLPKGFIGRLLGRIMAWHNHPDNKWTVALLAVSGKASVLEVGFGPGEALKLILDTCPLCRVVGIDHSETMLTSARQLNRKAITDGRAKLELGAVENLPFTDCTFDKAFSINCIYFWQEPLRGLSELHRVLKPTGRLAITVRDKDQATYEAFRPEKLAQLLTQAGFSTVNTYHNGIASHPLICVVDVK